MKEFKMAIRFIFLIVVLLLIPFAIIGAFCFALGLPMPYGDSLNAIHVIVGIVISVLYVAVSNKAKELEGKSNKRNW